MIQERVLWVDKLKAFGILSVILGHIQSPFGAFIFSWHIYTNNIGHLMINNIQFGDWLLKFIISVILLHAVSQIKKIFLNRGIFKYV